MGRNRSRDKRKRRGGGGGKSGALTGLRGGFRRGVQAATGTAEKRPQSPARRALSNAVTVALVVVVVVLLLRRFGVIH
jgi:hypothetical protein